MERRSRHRIWLRDIHPYVFCDNYKKRHQVKKDGEFEIYFVNEEGRSYLVNEFRIGFGNHGKIVGKPPPQTLTRAAAATAFEEVFRGESETESIVDHHDDDHDDHHGH